MMQCTNGADIDASLLLISARHLRAATKISFKAKPTAPTSAIILALRLVSLAAANVKRHLRVISVVWHCIMQKLQQPNLRRTSFISAAVDVSATPACCYGYLLINSIQNYQSHCSSNLNLWQPICLQFLVVVVTSPAISS
jgi:hypothetical protein